MFVSGTEKKHQEVIEDLLSETRSLAVESDRITWGEAEALRASVAAELVPAKGLLAETCERLKNPKK